MKKRLIIHIGMHKTGSSSIQRFLSRNRYLLRAWGVYYPTSRGAGGQRQPKHNALFSAISHQADFNEPHPELESGGEQVHRLIRQIERARCTTAIISAEGLSGEKPDFAKALAPLAEAFDVQIIAFIRRHDVWVESFYKQMVLSREVREARSFDAFCDDPATRLHMQFATILGWWAAVFGDNAVSAVPFDQAADAGIVRTFLSAAGLPAGLNRLPHHAAHENRSFDATVIDIVRLANARGVDINVADLPQIAKEIGPRNVRFLTHERSESILKTCAQDCISLSKYRQSMTGSPFFMHHGIINASDENPWNAEASAEWSALFLTNLIKKYGNTKG